MYNSSNFLYKDVVRHDDNILYMAYYFPQFHIAPENKLHREQPIHYTDWNIIKEHNHSFTPLDYYDLTDPSVIDAQDKYANENNIHIPTDKKGAPPFSIDDNLYHTSTEGKVLENPKNAAPEFLFQRTVSPEKAPNKASFVTIGFKNGDPITVNGKKLSPGNLLEKLNEVAGKNGIGRVDLVENRFIGIKSRGVYETPGGTLLISAHRAVESVTLDKETMHKKDEIMPKYAELIYNGYWYSKARFKLQKVVDLNKSKVNGSVKLKLYKGNITIMSRQTKSAAYSMKKVSFEENKTFNKSNVEKFINFHKKKLR